RKGRCRVRASSGDQLARIEQPVGIESRLDAAQRCEPCGAVEFGEQVAFHLTDAMLRGDRTAKFKDMAVDEAAEPLAVQGKPVHAVHIRWRLDMVMHIAIAQMPE